MSNDPLRQLLEAISSAAEKTANAEFDHKQLHKMIHEPREEFAFGDLVAWKCEQLRPSKLPMPGHAMCFLYKMEEPQYDEKDGSGSQYYVMPLDCVVSALSETGDYIEFAVDSRRLKRA